MNIYQGNTTLTLGMIWMLIQKYQMRIHGNSIGPAVLFAYLSAKYFTLYMPMNATKG